MIECSDISKHACVACHGLQSNINAQGFRSLREGEAVDFDVEGGPDGRCKAINVTGPGGAAPQVGYVTLPHSNAHSRLNLSQLEQLASWLAGILRSAHQVP